MLASDQKAHQLQQQPQASGQFAAAAISVGDGGATEDNKVAQSVTTATSGPLDNETLPTERGLPRAGSLLLSLKFDEKLAAAADQQIRVNELRRGRRHSGEPQVAPSTSRLRKRRSASRRVNLVEAISDETTTIDNETHNNKRQPNEPKISNLSEQQHQIIDDHHLDKTNTTTTTTTTTTTNTRRPPLGEPRLQWPANEQRQLRTGITRGSASRVSADSNKASEEDRSRVGANRNQQQWQPWKHEQSSGNDTADQLAPLIHTDQLNTITKLLYIHPPKSFSQSQLLQQQQQHRQILSSRGGQPLMAPTTNHRKQKSQDLGQLTMAASEASFAPAQVAVLVASGSEPHQQQQQNQQQSMGSRQQRPTMMMLVPRFDVLDFEVTNSTATLTWSLSLFSVPYDGGGGGSNGNEDLGDANLQRQRTRLVGETAFQSDDRLDRLDAPIEIDDTASTDLRRLRRRRRRRDTDSVRATLNRRDDRRQPPVPPPLPPDDGLRELAELLEPEDIAGNREMTRHQSPATETRAKEKEDTRTIEPRPRPRELAEMSGFVRHGASDILRTNSTQIDDSVVTTNKTTTNTTTTNALATTSRGTPNPIRPLPVSSLGPTKRPPNRANRQQTTRSVDGPSTTSTTTITPTTAATKSAPTLVGRATSSGLNATTPTVNTATTSTKAPATSTNGTSANRFHQHQQQRLPSIPTNPPTRAATSNDEQEASVRTVSAVPMNRVSPLTGLIGRVTGAKLQMATMQARLASSSTTTTSTTSTTQKPIIASDHQMPAANLSTAGTERPHHRPLARQTTRTSKSVKLNSVAMDSPEANTTLPITLIPELGDRNRSLATEPTFASNKTATLSSTSTIPPIDTSALTARVTSKITSANSDSPLSSSSSSSRGADERDEAPSSKSVQFSEPEQKSTQATATTTSTSSTTVAPSSSSTTTTSTTSTTTTTTTTPPPPTPQSSPSTTVNNVVSVTKSQLVTSESLQRPSPNTRLTHTGSLASSSSQTQHRNKPQVPTVSKWMVRLRRFGSNEIDVVKVVVNELDQLLISKGDGVSSSSNGEGTPASEPIIRSITFKNLEPASGYEICVESASPNQLIGDKMNILNANHFLKCHDVSDVELNSNINNNNKSDARRNVTSSEDAILRRMDLMVDGNMRQAQPRLGELNHDELPLVNATSSSGAPLNKLKSLCREFFTTLNNNAAQAVPQAVLNLTTTGGAAAKQPARLSPNEPVALADSQSQDDSKTTATAATMNLTASSGQWPMIGGEHPRRPKSLLDQQQSEFGSGSSKQTTGQGNALKSHIELMEINLGNQGRPTETNGQKQQASSSIFEVVASSSNRQQLPQRVGVQEQDSMGPPTLLRAIQAQQPNSSTYPINSILTNYRFDAAGSMQPSHILPIVGCVFVLIFLATIANMLLNLVQCERSGRNPGGGGGGARTAGSGGGSSAEEILASQAGGNRLVRHLNTAKRRRRRRQRLADALAAASAGSGGPRLGSPQSPTQMLAAGGAGLDSGSRSSPLLRAMGPGGRGFSSQSISGSYYSAGSEHSATSRSRMVIIGRNGEPFGSASGYFDVPPERRTEPAVDYGHISPGCLSVTSSSGHHPLLRSSREQQQAKGSNSSQVHRGRRHTGGGGGQTNETDLTSPHLATVNRSMHLLTSAARFPIGPSFAGDEKHNADMVGLARRNYDNFINNIYNADNLTSEVLANGQLHSGRQTIANNRHTTTTDDATVCSFHKQQELRNEGVTESVSSAASSAATVEAGAVKRAPGSRQRLRYDKVNPIYNMDNFSTETRSRDDRHTTLATFGGSRQQQAMQRRSAPDSAAAGGTITEDNQMADRDNLECSICNGSNGGANQIANSNQNQGPDNDGHSPEGDTSQSSPSGLDRQKQRFHAQQQQLERVMSKSGSLVPQPFINVNVGDSSADAGAYATFPEEEEGPNMGPAMAGDASTTKVDPSGGDSGLDQFVFGESLNEANQTHTGANHQVEHHHQDLEQQNQESQETTTVTVAVQQQLPPVPPPPPPLPALSPAPGSATNEGRSSQQASSKQSMGRISGGSKLPPTQSLADVQAMKGSTMMPNDEAIDKSDFRQRRNELAAKLHLAGMNKQQ